MTKDNPPRLAERVFTLFSERMIEWLGEQGIMIRGLACVLVLAWQAKQRLQETPEFKFILDLTIDAIVAVAFSRFIQVFTDEIVEHSHESQGFASTKIGEWVIMSMEALHYLPLLTIFVFQALQLWKDLREK